MIRRVAPVAFAVVLAVASCGTAFAQTQTGVLASAADGLRDDPVYVDRDAERSISSADADRVRAAIRSQGAGPLYISVLPEAAADEAGGDPEAALREIAVGVGEPGTYAAVIGSAFRAGATSEEILPRGRAGELASEALDSARSGGTTAVLLDFVRRVGAARAGDPGGGSGGDGGGGFPWLLAALGLGGVLLAWRRFQRNRRRREELNEVKEFARDDLVALGDDIGALDIDMEMPGVDEDAKRHYGRAVELYVQAEEAWDRMRDPADAEHVSALLEEGRYEMTAAQAHLEGRPTPERRPPCFFDPRHGPSVGEVDWAPPGGAPRPVPACAADVQRLEDGREPDIRQASVGGVSTPYWNAGPAYLPWAGGFFGGGLLPGLFLGSMLGSGFGFFGGMAGAEAAADGDFGDGMGDFGSGFDDLGGGDFGGGDFGGGGDF